MDSTYIHSVFVAVYLGLPHNINKTFQTCTSAELVSSYSMRTTLLLWIVWALCCTGVTPYKILFISEIFPSVQRYMANLAEALASAGNDVTYVLPSPLAKIYEDDLHKNGVNVFTYQTDATFIFDNQTFTLEFGKGCIEKDIEKIMIVYKRLCDSDYQHMRSMFKDQDFMSFVNESGFDMLILNMLKSFISPAIIAYKFSIPFISVNTIQDPWGLRVPALPSFVPHAPMCDDCTEHMTFFQRLKNAHYHFSMSTHLHTYGQDMPLYQFWMLDILVVCSCITTLSVLMFVAFLCMLFKYIKSCIYKADKIKSS